MSTQYDTELQQDADNSATLNMQDSILMKTSNVSLFNFLYKRENDIDWQEYVPAANDILNVGGNVTITVSDFKAQSWFDDVREIKLPNRWNNGIEDVDVTSIGDRAFSGCGGFTSVTIPDSVTSIRSGAFEACNSLTSITIPNSVTSIGSSAFSGCNSLTSITIPNSVTSIGDVAFSGCNRLTSIMIGNSVTSIGQNAFFGCSGLTNMTIPISVTNIRNNAFLYCDALTSMTFTGKDKATIQDMANYPWGLDESVIQGGVWPDTGEVWNGLIITRRSIDGGPYKETVDGIEWTYYVEDGESLVHTIDLSIVGTVYVPYMLGGNPVTAVHEGAFNGCSISEVVMHDGITEIQSNAFSNCLNMQHLSIPYSVTSIASSICNGCSNLTSIYIPINGVYKSTRNMLFTADGKTLVHGINGNVNVPNGTLSIGQYAFALLPNLSSVSLPSNFYAIGNYAFSGCSSLVNITGSAKEIGYGAFSGTGLSSAFLPSGILSVYSSAFSNCSKLVSAFICPGINYLGDILFLNCQNLADATISAADSDAYAINYRMFYNCSALSNIDLQGEITAVNNYAFYNCSSLTSIVLPSAVNKIDSNFFWTTGSNKQYPWLALREKTAAEISAMRYYPWRLDKTHIWPGEKCTFATANESSKLQPCFISGLLDADDLSGVHDIWKLEVGSNVTSIGVSALSGQSWLGHVSLPDSVSSIGASAFAQCDGNLTSINIPSSVTSIGDYAFADSILETIMFFGDAPAVGTEIFSGIDPSAAAVYVHANASGFTLDQDGKWQGLQLKYLEDVSYIRYEDGHIETFPDTVSVDISEMLTAYPACSPVYIYINAAEIYNSIDGSYYNLDALKYIHFGENVLYIDDIENGWSPFYAIKSLDAFITDSGCGYTAVNGLLLTQDLTMLVACTTGHVEIPNTVSSVLAEVGYTYSNLTSITIPDSVVEMQEEAFGYAEDLAKLAIGNGLTSFSDYVFRGTTALRDLSIGSSLSSINILGTNCNISSIYVDPENQYYSSKDKMLLSKDGKELRYAIDTLSVTVPDGVEVICAEAFYGRSSVDTVVLADTVSLIEAGVFDDNNIKTVNLSSLSSIGREAFKDCTNLEHVNLGTLLTAIPDSLFSGCIKLSSVDIPNTVICIDPEAFYKTNLTSVSLPSSVLCVDIYAFSDCSSLVSMSAYGLDTIFRYSIFNDCDNLESVFISSNLENIYTTKVFERCQKLKYAYMPNAVKIPYSMFKDCISLSSMPDCLYLHLHDISKEAFAGTSIQSAQISCNIGDRAFSDCAQLKNVEIYGNHNIGENAFLNCSNLSAFSIILDTELCSYDEVRKKSGYPWGIAQTGVLSASLARSFSTLAWYTDATYASNILSICPFGLQEYSPDVQYAILSGDIPLTADAGNGSTVFLKKLLIGPMVSSIADSAFDLEAYENISHSLLAEIGFYKYKQSDSAQHENAPVLQKTGKRSFFGHNSLSSVQLPDEVTCINSKTFYNCTSLSSISLPSALAMFGSYVFKNDELLSSIDVPASVKEIGKHTFENCPSLEYAHFSGKSFLELSAMKNSFWDLDLSKIQCEFGMTTVIYSDGSTKQFATANSIPPYMFADSNITDVFVGEDVTHIDNYAFLNCSRLSNVVILLNIQSISLTAFNGCSMLQRVVFSNMSLALIRQVAGWPFNVSECILLGEHSDTIATYRNGDISCFSIKGKLKYNDISSPETDIVQLEIGTDVTSISAETFKSMSLLSCVTVPKTVDKISNAAFKSCSDLEVLAIDNGITAIGRDAFDSCTKLEHVNIPASVESIGTNAFLHCTGLREVTALANRRASIGAHSFYHCSNLQKFTMSNEDYVPEYSLKYDCGVDKGAFRECTSLLSAHFHRYMQYYGTSVFLNCSSLVDVDFATRAEAQKYDGRFLYIQASAFLNSGLKTLYIPSSVYFKSSSASFRGTGNLKTLHFIDRSLAELRYIDGYPWGANKSIITADYP